MSSEIGIYRNHFLFEFQKRAMYFECSYCHLVSPKNYYLLCKHCFCQTCIKDLVECPFDDNKIILEGKKPTAFQFIITYDLLYPFLMKCVFKDCNWAGTFKNFIENHYNECNYRYDNTLLSEYFRVKNNQNNKTKSKSRKTKNKNKNEKEEKIIELEEENNSSNENNNERYIFLNNNENNINISNSYLSAPNNINNKENEEGSDIRNNNYIELDSEDIIEENENLNK